MEKNTFRALAQKNIQSLSPEERRQNDQKICDQSRIFLKKYPDMPIITHSPLSDEVGLYIPDSDFTVPTISENIDTLFPEKAIIFVP